MMMTKRYQFLLFNRKARDQSTFPVTRGAMTDLGR